MAKYTILYKEYKDAGGKLPASFTQLVELWGNEGFDFGGAFEARNLLREIGQETLDAFYDRLDAKARQIYPRVKMSLEALTTAAKGRTRKETTTQNLTGQTDSTFDKGQVKQTRNHYQHPLTVGALNGSETTDGDEVTTTSGADTQNTTTTNGGTITREYEENTIDTALAYADLVDRYRNIFEDTLRAFDGCFLGVW